MEKTYSPEIPFVDENGALMMVRFCPIRWKYCLFEIIGSKATDFIYRFIKHIKYY